MQVYVDESGDSGNKKGSSEYFVVTLMLVEDDVAEALVNRIAQLRQDMKKPDRFEYHFKERSDADRLAFFEAVAPYKFRHVSCVVNKRGYYADGLPGGKEFFRWVCGQVFERAMPYMAEARVVLDQHSEREFVREIAAFLKRLANEPDAAELVIKSVTMQDSRANDLLQLADMVCGAVTRSFRTDRGEPERFRKTVKHREVSVLVLPD